MWLVKRTDLSYYKMKQEKKKYFKLIKGAGGGGGCFPAGTLISTPNGKIKIEDITPGDIVYGFDHQSGQIQSCEVIKTYKHSWGEVGRRSPLIKIIHEEGEIILTENHWVFTENGYSGEDYKYLEAKYFNIGDFVTTESNNKSQILDIIFIGEYDYVYNFEVENAHNYIAENIKVHNGGGGGGKGGCFQVGTLIDTPCGKVLIENIKIGDIVYAFDHQSGQIQSCEVLRTHKHSWGEVGRRSPLIKIIHEEGEITLTKNHWVFTENGYSGEHNKYIEAGDLYVGEYLTLKNNNKSKILDIIFIGEYDYVYNFEVENAHNYIAENIKVHNGGGGGKGSPPPCTPSPNPDPHKAVEVSEGIYKHNGGDSFSAAKRGSRTEIEIVDLISEGPIEGLVSGSYTFLGQTGNIGWDSFSFTPYAGGANNYLRSVYWKGTTVINSAGQFNYGQVNFQFLNGSQTVSAVLNSNVRDQIVTATIPQTSRTITVNDVVRFGSDFKKVYDIRNSQAATIILSVKIGALFVTQNDPSLDKQTFDLGCNARVTMSQTIGDIRNNQVILKISISRIESNGTTTVIYNNEDYRIKGKIATNRGFIEQIPISVANFRTDTQQGWRIEIERLTTESDVVHIKDIVQIDAITEVWEENFVYPKAAVFKNLFRSEYFAEAPDRAYDVKLLKIKIPSNYDPIKRTYNGDWDGRFSDEFHPSGNGLYWTDNPAWCYYDLITNKRYGLGKYVEKEDVDKWNLYQIGKYCDELVSDGKGGLEPRFTCNTLISDFGEAYNILGDMASIFRGMAYYAFGSIYTISDMPKDPLVIFTNSNVENGDFSYSSSSRKVRNSVVTVRYNDNKNLNRPTIEYVEDPDAIRKYGIRKLEITAFGCTSQAQANRLGKWALISQQFETETVDFIAGHEATYLKPGDIIKIQDSNKIFTRIGGRVLAYSGQGTVMSPYEFVLDHEYQKIYDYAVNNYNTNIYFKGEILTPTFRVTGSTYNDFLTGYERTEIQNTLFRLTDLTGVSGYSPDPNKILTKLTWYNTLDTTNYVLQSGTIWSIQTTGTGILKNVNDQNEMFRVIGVTEIDPHKYAVNGLEYNPQKYLQIESGIKSEDAPAVNPSIQFFEASYPNSTILSQSGIYLQYIISPPVLLANRDTSTLDIYLKSGSDFSAGDLENRYVDLIGATVLVPKEDFLARKIVANTTSNITGFIFPPGNNQTYYTRVYGLNGQGYFSPSWAASNVYYTSSEYDDTTNIINLGDFKYQSELNSNLINVGQNLPSGNLFIGDSLNFSLSLSSQQPLIKNWKTNELTFRYVFGTGTFDYNNKIAEYSGWDPTEIATKIISTGFNSTKLSTIYSANTISGFWLAIDATPQAYLDKFSSQTTALANYYTRPSGYVFGQFNYTPVTGISTGAGGFVLNADGSLSINAPNEINDNLAGFFVYLTDEVTKTGNLTDININATLSKQFDPAPPTGYPSFVKSFEMSGIQIRKAVKNGNSYNTSPFFATIGGPLKSGWAKFRGFNKLEAVVINSYNEDYLEGSIYDSGNFPATAPVQVDYGSLPVGVLNTYRWVSNDSRNLANRLLFLKSMNSDSQLVDLTGEASFLVDVQQFNQLSGYLDNKIDTLSGYVSGNFVRKKPGGGVSITGILSAESGLEVMGDVEVTGSISATQNLNISGNTILGNSLINDTISFNSRSITDFVPDSTVRNLGSTSLNWGTGYLNRLQLGGDANLYRSTADTLKTDDSFIVDGANFTVNSATITLGDAATDTITINAGPVNLPNATSAADALTLGTDTVLYRSAADTLKTDVRFVGRADFRERYATVRSVLCQCGKAGGGH